MHKITTSDHIFNQNTSFGAEDDHNIIIIIEKLHSIINVLVIDPPTLKQILFMKLSLQTEICSIVTLLAVYKQVVCMEICCALTLPMLFLDNLEIDGYDVCD